MNVFGWETAVELLVLACAKIIVHNEWTLDSVKVKIKRLHAGTNKHQWKQNIHSKSN